MASIEEVSEGFGVLREKVETIDESVNRLASAITAHEGIIKKANLSHWEDLNKAVGIMRTELENIIDRQDQQGT